MTLTEFLEYMIDNSDGPVTFSIAGAKVSVNLTGERETKPTPFGKTISLAEAREIALRAVRPEKKTGSNMREVFERTVRAANNLGPDWIPGDQVSGCKGSATQFLRSKKIPFTIFYGANGKGTKMAFVRAKDL